MKLQLAQNCLACPLAQHRKRIVWGHGPYPARIMLLGQNPGIAEDRSGKPFVGPSGKELEYLLWRMGIRRDDVFVSNVCKCRGKDDADLDPAWVETCAGKWLVQELRLVQPDLIVAMGGWAARWLLAATTPHQMELIHGFLYPAARPEAEGIDVLPAYHPAAGLHNPSLLAQCQWDMAHIKPALFGELPYGPRVGPQPEGTDYRIATRPQDIDEVLRPDDTAAIGIDTETTEGGRPWCLTATTIPGTAVMVMADRVDLVRHLQRHVEAYDLTAVIHNLLFDYQVLAGMGFHVNMARVFESMIAAYQLQFLPKGLKPLAYRLSGVVMDSYKEVTRPARFAKAMAYLRRVAEGVWPDPEPVLELKADGSPHIKRPQNVGKKVRRVLLDVEKGRCDTPWKRWADMDGTDVVERAMGPMPDGWLSDLPLEVAKGYACLSKFSKVRMADGTLMSIGDIVRHRHPGPVLCRNLITTEIESKPVVNWYRTRTEEEIDWKQVITTISQKTKWGRFNGPWYTPDHKIMTNRGFVEVQKLTTADLIVTPYNSLTKTQKQILLGGCIGDGYISQRNKPYGFACFGVGHSEAQVGYLRWKQKVFGSLVSSEHVLPERHVIIENKPVSHGKKFYSFQTSQHPEIRDIKSTVIVEDRVAISDWVYELNDVGWAIVYGDDGCLVKNSAVRIYTMSFTEPEILTMNNALRKNLGVESGYYRESRKGKYVLTIGTHYSKIFFERIAPFMHPSVAYKIPEEFRTAFYDPSRDDGLPYPYCSNVIEIVNAPKVAYRGVKYVRYCIEVADNHNFLTIGEMAKNCQDSDMTRRIHMPLRRLCEERGLI